MVTAYLAATKPYRTDDMCIDSSLVKPCVGGGGTQGETRKWSKDARAEAAV